MGAQAMTISFEDHGQDFLEWDIDADGVVVACRPFQASLWCGNTVANTKGLRRGSRVVYRSAKHGFTDIRYPVAKVVRHKRKAA